MTDILAFFLICPSLQGYHPSKKPYKGKVALSTLQKSARNKIIEIGEVYNVYIAIRKVSDVNTSISKILNVPLFSS